MASRTMYVSWLLCICVLYLTDLVSSRQLVLVQTVFRHGDRAPSDPYPLDPYNVSFWPRGWSQLTNVGMVQTHGLGQFFRKRYVDDFKFLSPAYNRDEVYVRSSDKDRAIVSALAMLSGLFPPDDTQTWDKGISWQPIPVHSAMPYKNDLLLKPTSVKCELYEQVYEEESRDLHDRYNKQYKEFFDFVAEKTGFKTLNLDTISDVYTAIFRERVHNLVQPDWVDQTWQNSTVFDLIVELKRVSRLAEFNSPRLSKLRGGYLLGDLVQRMQKKADDSLEPPKKMIVYSAHDGTVTPLMYAMGVGNNLLTPYAAALILELYEEEKGIYSVQVLYRNGTDMQTPFVMQVPSCPSDDHCPLDLFLQVLRPQMFTSRNQFDQACGHAKSSASTLLISNAGRSLLLTIVIFALFGHF